jgi:hypothetical protein
VVFGWTAVQAGPAELVNARPAPDGRAAPVVAGDDGAPPPVVLPANAKPLPLPLRTDKQANKQGGQGSLVSYDVATDVETVHNPELLPARPVAAEPVPRMPIELVDTGELNFGSLVQVPNPDDALHRVNCKVFMRWGSSWYVGSGTLIDPNFVITAGHCVHWGPGGSWADEIVVVPAYENNNAPWGAANAAQMWTWGGSINGGDHDDGIGGGKLDCPAGGIGGRSPGGRRGVWGRGKRGSG